MTSEVRAAGASWSCGLYQRIVIPNSNVKPVRELLDNKHPFDKGVEPGSMWYLKESTNRLIRTKALQHHSCLVYPKGDAIIPVNPRVFADPELADGDILMAKDSNVGECAIVDGNSCANHMFSGGILRLWPTIDRYYFFAFLKHQLFKQQLLTMVPKGATIRHAKSLWLDCLIPFPDQQDAGKVVQYVSAMMRTIIQKEKAIRRRSDAIHSEIQTELETNQQRAEFHFEYPKVSDLRSSKRLDARIHDAEYKSKIWLVENYKHGYVTPKEDGFTVTPGPSLEIKILGTRIDSDNPQPNFYSLILPMNISVYGTMNVVTYLGTHKKLPLLQKGDIVFGEAGFHKGRSIVLLEGIENCTTNAHGLYARRADGNLSKSIFFRCVFSWYRTMRLIDLMAVGGSGGHFSPEYFDYIRIPCFPDHVRRSIVKLYHNPVPPPRDKITVGTFVDWHQRWNERLGIWELDREMKLLQRRLAQVQAQIIQAMPVALPF